MGSSSVSSPDVSIIILNYQSRELVRYCLRSIRESKLTCTYEIIIVDNQSKDGIERMVRTEEPSAVLVLSEKNRGYAAGNNLGIQKARGRFLLILNPDIVVFPHTIEALVNFLLSHPKAAVVGPKLVNPDRSIQDSCYRFPTPLVPVYRRTSIGKFRFAQRTLDRYTMKDDPHTDQRTVDWILGACLLVRASAIRDVGLMDDRFFLYFEDIDWCRRFWNTGWEVWYEPSVELVHYHHRESQGQGIRALLSRATRAHLRSGLRYFWKHLRKPLPKRPHVL